MRPIDLLIITPLEDERATLDYWFDTANHTWENLPLGVHWSMFADFSIGVYCIMGKGGITAGNKCSRIVEAYRPKSVLLIGIAGGDELNYDCNPLFNIGDVGYNNYIYYCSYGKATAQNNLPQIRSLVRVQNNWLARCARYADMETWQETAKRWFDQHKQTWESRHYIDQVWPNNYIPVAHEADVGSGELLVENPDWKNNVRGFHQGANIRLWEMEAFAVASVCLEFSVPFLMIRGISDHADLLREKEKDNYRLISSVVASAYAKSLVESDEYKSGIRGIAHSTINRIDPCLIESVISPCVHRHRCVELDWRLPSSNKVGLVSAYENITPQYYSNELAEYISANFIDTNYSISFIFPYSPLELLGFFKETLSGDKSIVEMVGSIFQLHLDRNALIDRPSSTKANDADRLEELNHMIYKLLERLCQRAREYYKHFAVASDTFSQLSDIIGDDNKKVLALRMNRLIVLRGDAMDENTIQTDPLIHIYPLFLGDNIPTFFVSERYLLDERAAIDDMTFILRGSISTDGITDEDEWPVAIRFFPSSKLLIFTGTPCSSSGLVPTSVGMSTSTANLYNIWRNHLHAYVDGKYEGRTFLAMPSDG